MGLLSGSSHASFKRHRAGLPAGMVESHTAGVGRACTDQGTPGPGMVLGQVLPCCSLLPG